MGINHIELGRERGRRAGAGAKNLAAQMTEAFAFWHKLHPTAADIDFASAVRDIDRQRLEDVPPLARFPELAGHADLLRAERAGFREVSGADETATAFFYSSDFYMRRPLNARHLAHWDLMTMYGDGCTNVFIPDGAEGVTLGDNRDVPLPDAATLHEYATSRPDYLFTQNRDGVHWCQGGVSAAVLLDDEPECSFPADPFVYDYLVPQECIDDIDVMIEFLTRYNEFWGPGNKILVDRKLNAVAVDKTNCKVAFRKPTVNGAVAVTACAYLDDELSAHQLERAARVAEIKGDTLEENLDYNYHLGSRRRYQRLVDLTNDLATGRPTIWDALELVSDHAVPYPDRVCLAGESCHSETRNPLENWSVLQHAAVISGPNQRALYRRVMTLDNPLPVYDYTPRLLLAPGVAMQPEWQADIDAGRCTVDAPATNQ